MRDLRDRRNRRRVRAGRDEPPAPARGPDDEGFLVAGPAGTFPWGGDDTPEAVLRSGARVPFLDYRVVELALGMDDREKLGEGVTKRVLRTSMRGLVPDVVLDRRDEMGSVTAEPLWMRRDPASRFRGALEEAVRTLPTILDPSILRRFDDAVAGRSPFDHRYWRAVCAGQWVRSFSVAV